MTRLNRKGTPFGDNGGELRTHYKSGLSSLKQVHKSASALKGKRLSFVQRLHWLGIDESDYRKYEEMFLRYREASHYIQRTEDSWVAIKHPWNKREVLRHLTGERTIGLFPGEKLDYMMIDIDRHDHEDKCTLKSRIDSMRQIIPGQPLLYQSSFSGGLRLCYFLTEPMPKRVLHEGFKKLMVTHDLIVKPGQLEIMATNKGDRLPFGEGSYLVDPRSLTIIEPLTPKKTISRTYDVFLNYKIDLPFQTRESSTDWPIHTQEDNNFRQIVDRLYEEGLYPEISTNDALLELCWDFHITKGYSKEETETVLTSWILKKHNGLSNRMNAGKMDEVIAQIKRIVSKIDPGKTKYQGSKYALREKKLSLSAVRKIRSLTDKPKLQQAIFSLLEYCNNFKKCTNYFNRENTNTKISNSYMSVDNDMMDQSTCQRRWYCDISKETLKHLPGFDKANPQIAMREIVDLGVLSLKRRAHPASHHCRQYWVHFDFDENDPFKVVSLDEGLLRLNESERGVEPCTKKGLELCDKV